MQDKVKEFHKKNDYPCNHRLPWEAWCGKRSTHWLLKLVGRIVIWIVARLQNKANRDQADGDCRLYRSIATLEEVAETMIAMADGNEAEMADGLTDTLYFVLGTGVTYDIPLADCFDEVHRANMDKKKRSEDNPRMRDKGKDWTPPDIRTVLRIHRLDSQHPLDVMFFNLQMLYQER
jgi:predicted HAD superfamily Cof-like phosphohydrolase